MSYEPITLVSHESRVILSDQVISGSPAAFAAVTIPSGVYDYLEVLLHAKSNYTVAQGDAIYIVYNSDTTDANYNWQRTIDGQFGGTSANDGGDTRVGGRVGTAHATNDANAYSANHMLIQGISRSVDTTNMNHVLQNRVNSKQDNYIERWFSTWESTSNVTNFAITTVSGTAFALKSVLRVIGVKVANNLESI